PRIATASRLPTDATALLMPDAAPVRAGGTAFITPVVSGATVSAMPKPSAAIGRNTVVQYAPSGRDRPRSAKPQAAIAGPITSGQRMPKRSIRPPAQRDRAAMINVNGRKAAPVAVAE